MEKILFVALLLASLTRCVNRFLALPEFIYYGIYLGSFLWLLFRGGMMANKKYLFYIRGCFFYLAE